MESDCDCTITMNTTIGETFYNEVVIHLYEHYNGDEDYFKIEESDLTNVVAIIDKDDLAVMAKRLKIPAKKVRSHLIDKFYDGGYISRKSYVVDCFKEILEYIYWIKEADTVSRKNNSWKHVRTEL